MVLRDTKGKLLNGNPSRPEVLGASLRAREGSPELTRLMLGGGYKRDELAACPHSCKPSAADDSMFDRRGNVMCHTPVAVGILLIGVWSVPLSPTSGTEAIREAL